MNMHGIITPIDTSYGEGPSRFEQARDWIWRKRVFGVVVVLPTLLVAAYLFLIAADQYESEAHFLVRSANTQPVAGTGISQALSMVTGASAAQSEAISVADYLTSHDVVDTLRRDDRLVERFHTSDGDVLSRLWSADPAPERLLRYYRGQVKVHYNTETGITEVKVRSFHPGDSYDIIRKLLELGERRVNVLNARSYNDALRMAEKQLKVSEDELAAASGRLTAYRQARGDIDPQATGQAQIGLVTTLTAQLAASRAQLVALGNAISTSSPQYVALAARVRALEGQVGAQSGRLTGGGRTIAANIGGYENLKLREEFLAKRYEAAAASLDRARDQALRQQLYLVRVVDANRPVKALFPERWRIVATVLISLLLAYAIGWLLVAGVKEHAA